MIVSGVNNLGSLYCNRGRVGTIEFSSFKSVIIYKGNLYKYEGQVYILTPIIKGVRTTIAGHDCRKATS